MTGGFIHCAKPQTMVDFLFIAFTLLLLLFQSRNDLLKKQKNQLGFKNWRFVAWAVVFGFIVITIVKFVQDKKDKAASDQTISDLHIDLNDMTNAIKKLEEFGVVHMQNNGLIKVSPIVQNALLVNNSNQSGGSFEISGNTFNMGKTDTTTAWEIIYNRARLEATDPNRYRADTQLRRP